jgi:hypothetical protein
MLRHEAIANYTGRICMVALPPCDCFVPRNDIIKKWVMLSLSKHGG